MAPEVCTFCAVLLPLFDTIASFILKDSSATKALVVGNDWYYDAYMDANTILSKIPMIPDTWK